MQYQDGSSSDSSETNRKLQGPAATPTNFYDLNQVPTLSGIHLLVEIIAVRKGSYVAASRAAEKLVRLIKDGDKNVVPHTKSINSALSVANNLGLRFSESDDLVSTIKCINALVQLSIGANLKIDKLYHLRSSLEENHEQAKKWSVYDLFCQELTTELDEINVSRFGAFHSLAINTVIAPNVPLERRVPHTISSMDLRIKPKKEKQFVATVPAAIVELDQRFLDPMLEGLLKEVKFRTHTRDIEQEHLDGLAFAFGALSTVAAGIRYRCIQELLQVNRDESGEKMAIFVGKALYYIQEQGVGLENEIFEECELSFLNAKTAEHNHWSATAYAEYASYTSGTSRRFFSFCKCILDSEPKFTGGNFFSGIGQMLQKGYTSSKSGEVNYNSFWQKQLDASDVLGNLAKQFPNGNWVTHSRENRAKIFDGIINILDKAHYADTVINALDKILPIIPHLTNEEVSQLGTVLINMCNHTDADSPEGTRGRFIREHILSASLKFDDVSKVRVLKIISDASKKFTEDDASLMIKLKSFANKISRLTLSKNEVKTLGKLHHALDSVLGMRPIQEDPAKPLSDGDLDKIHRDIEQILKSGSPFDGI